MRVLQRRPSSPETWEHGRYLRVFTTADGLVLTGVENRGSIDAPDVRLAIFAGAHSPETRRSIVRTVEKILGLGVDPAPLHAAATRLPSLRPTALALRGMRPPRFATLFDTFASVIPFQQLSIDAGAAIVARLVERFGERITYGDRTYVAMPTADAVAGSRLATLLACGLSRSKAEALRQLAKAVANGALREEAFSELATSEALELLTELPGIGPWSAAVVMLRGFGRLDVFPPGDSGAKRGLNELLRLRAPEELFDVVESFGSYRGYLYLCGLGARLLAKGEINPAPMAAP